LQQDFAANPDAENYFLDTISLNDASDLEKKGCAAHGKTALRGIFYQ
jgi:hypothetical protein